LRRKFWKRQGVDIECGSGVYCPATPRCTIKFRSARIALRSTGQSREAILQEYPYLEDADIDAVLAFAARQADHPVIAAE
jgi:hypothetical protein